MLAQSIIIPVTRTPSSLGVRQACLPHVRGAGAHDEPQRTSAWEAISSLPGR